MQIKQFTETRAENWQELDTLLAEAKGSPERLPPDELMRLGELYRRTAADLAIARREFPGDPVIRDLEVRASRSRAAIYGKSSRREAILNFFVDGYWAALYQRRRALWLASAFFFGAAVFGAAFSTLDPSGAAGAVPEAFLWVTEAESTGSSGPGFRKIESGMPIFPTSCN